MAIQVTRSNRRTYDNNPQGSSTAVVTTAADNPFERGVSMTTRSMLPGLGAEDVSMTTRSMLPGLGEDVPAAPAGGGVLDILKQGLATIGLAKLQQEVLGTPKINTLPAAGSSNLPAAGAISLTAPGGTAVPPANSVYPVRGNSVPQGGGIMGKLPWIIGGVAVLGIGSLLVFKK